ncbi:heterokaryon incompatibility protein-domain-containing protein [Scleroderma citrinum]
MYLLNASTKELRRFDRPPPYAILSHRWHNDEVTFHDVIDSNLSRCHSKVGYTKIEGCCDQAQQDGLDWVWIDTCCIDKSSSADLSEALNSMYAWYKKASTCYGYLDDVLNSKGDPTGEHSEFHRSEWFTRGWTLQELLAPKSVLFFSADWKMIGSKASLATTVAKITGVHKDVLLHPGAHESFSVAARMSWAAQRKTTREEDRAYSLMGLFDVHMPIIYGEGGKKAFLRLQRKIMKISNDQSILAWKTHFGSCHGPLADSPDQFEGCGDIYCIPTEEWSRYWTHRYRPLLARMKKLQLNFFMTNDGLNITLPLRQTKDIMFEAVLSCSHGPPAKDGNAISPKHSSLVHIHLQQPDLDVPRYLRMEDKFVTPERNSNTQLTNFTLQNIHLVTFPRLPKSGDLPNLPDFRIQYVGVNVFGFTSNLLLEPFWTLEGNEGDITTLTSTARHDPSWPSLKAARVDFWNESHGEHFAVTMGVAVDASGFRPWISLTTGDLDEGDSATDDAQKDRAIQQLATGWVVDAIARKFTCRLNDHPRLTFRVIVEVSF